MAKYYLHLTQEESWAKAKDLITELHKKADLEISLDDILQLIDECKKHPYAKSKNYPLGSEVRREAYQMANGIWPSSLAGQTEAEKARSLLSSLIIGCMPTNGGRPGILDCHYVLAERLGIKTGVRVKLHPSEILYEIKRYLPDSRAFATQIFKKNMDALINYYPSQPLDA